MKKSLKAVDLLGKMFTNSLGSVATVIEINGSKDVTVLFENTNYVKNTRVSALMSGSFKSPYCKSVYGVGFVGEGDYKVSINGKATIAYDVWNSMLTRCYSEKYSVKNKSYEGCTVHQDWHNFQNFAEWYCNHKFYGLGYQLDKDITLRGNKVYHEKFCSLVPKEVNTSIVNCEKPKGAYLLGVYYHNRDKVFISRTLVNGKRKELGRFSTAKEAFHMYKRHKENHLKQLAVKYEGKMETIIIQALMEWEIVSE